MGECEFIPVSPAQALSFRSRSSPTEKMSVADRGDLEWLSHTFLLAVHGHGCGRGLFNRGDPSECQEDVSDVIATLGKGEVTAVKPDAEGEVEAPCVGGMFPRRCGGSLFIHYALRSCP